MAICSASGIALELVLTRVLSVMYWQSLVYVVITIALLGFGASGTLLAIAPALQRGNLGTVQLRLIMLYALSALLSIYVISLIEIDAVNFASSFSTGLKLTLILLLLTLPFICLGLSINLMLVRLNSHINLLYCFNLAGSGVGALLFLSLLAPLGAPKLILLSVLLPLLFSFVLIRNSLRLERIIWLAMIVLLSCACIMPGFSPFTFTPCASKVMGYMTDSTKYPDAHVEFTKWMPFGRLDVLASDGYYAQGEDGSPVPMKYITTDGDAYTWLQKAQSDLTRLPRFSFGMNFAYLLKKAPTVLCIGVGGGQDIKLALAHGAKKVVGVDINPATIDLIESQYTDYAGNLKELGDVTFFASEGRSFARHCPDSFDIVYMNGVDTFTALSSGAYTMVENYLYTQDAFVDYLNRLADDGILAISRYAFRTPRETARVFATALAALNQIGVSTPTDHIIVNIDVDWGTVMVKRTPFTRDEIQTIKVAASNALHTLVYYPGLEQEPLTEENLDLYGRRVLDAVPFKDSINMYTALARSWQLGTQGVFFDDYPYDIHPVNDNRPFFYQFFRLRDFFKSASGHMSFAASGGVLGWSLLLFLVAFSLLASALLIILPLFFFRYRKISTTGLAPSIVFFTAIGLAYISIELATIQRFSLFLGHPVLSMACIMSAFLCVSGLGSLVVNRRSLSNRVLLLVAVLSILILVAGHLTLVPKIQLALLSVALPLRVLVAIFLTAPLAFFMGMFFPVGIRRLATTNPAALPWACAANGSASVVGSVCSILLAIQLGFSQVLLCGAALYLVALFAGLGGTHPAQES